MRGDPTRRPTPWALLAALALGPAAPGAAEIFVDLAAETGLDFVHFNGMSGEFYIVENTGQGAALFDYDGDGDLDAYLVQGEMLGPGRTLADALFAPHQPPPLGGRLYRNDFHLADDGRRVVRFVDVTEASAIPAGGYGMGVAAADYDGDGYVDLYLTNAGSNRLLRNLGDGRFEDRTAEAGVDDVRWSVPASFADFDRDGRLDLFVGNYLEFSYALHRPCPTPTGAPGYCSPIVYRPQSDRLFRGLPGGVFEDVTARAGLERAFGRALGSVATDVDGDGWTDLYVANDQSANQLWVNDGRGGFSDEALLSGSALNWQGLPEASMGVAAGDVDGDGDEDLLLGHFVAETNTLYVNDGDGNFRDATLASGLGTASLPYTTFGAAWLDWDSDGVLDAITANGAVTVIEALAARGDPYPLHEPNQLFRGLGRGRFEEVSGRAGPVFELSEVSRGIAVGDVDNDGAADVLLTNNAGPVRLLFNRAEERGEWLGVHLVAASPAGAALGARVAVASGGRTATARVRSDGSYASASDPRVLFGLGRESAVSSCRVEWPDGATETWRSPPPAVYLVRPERPSGSR